MKIIYYCFDYISITFNIRALQQATTQLNHKSELDIIPEFKYARSNSVY